MLLNRFVRKAWRRTEVFLQFSFPPPRPSLKDDDDGDELVVKYLHVHTKLL